MLNNTHHLIDRKQGVDVENVAPPVIRTGDVIHCGWIKDRVSGQILHGHLDNAQDEQIGGGETHKPIGDQAEKVSSSSGELIGSLAQLVQLALGIRSEVNVRDQEATDEEEGVHTKRPIGDGLKEEVLLHLLAHLHVIGVLEDHDARVAQDDPGHAEGSQSMDARNGVRTHISIADRIEVRYRREGEQQLRVDAQLFRLVQMPLQVLIRVAIVAPAAMMIVVIVFRIVIVMVSIAAVIIVRWQIQYQSIQLLQRIRRLRVIRLLERIIVSGHRVTVIGRRTSNSRTRLAVVHHLLVLATQCLLQFAPQVNLE